MWQAEDVGDVGGQEAVAAMHVLAAVQVLMEPVDHRCHDLEGSLPQVHCTTDTQTHRHTDTQRPDYEMNHRDTKISRHISSVKLFKQILSDKW